MDDDRISLGGIGIILDGTNYHVWAKTMRFFLIGHEVWDIVTGDFSEPTDTNLADYSKHKAKWERNNARIMTCELLADEDRLKSQFSRGATMQQPAVFAASKHSFSPFHQHKNRNHILPNECKYCHGIGHWAKDCPSLVKDPSGMPSRHHSQSTHSSLPPHMSQSHTQHSAHPHSQASSSSSDSVAAITSQLQQLLEKNGGVSNIGASAFSASEYPLLEADWDHP
ncbi:hypothetical protein ACHQM5_029412 [Ranunculus cassubicifolius]